MDRTGCSEDLVTLSKATWDHIPEERNLHIHSYENLNFFKEIYRTDLSPENQNTDKNKYRIVAMLLF
jgi:hypothetical protein